MNESLSTGAAGDASATGATSAAGAAEARLGVRAGSSRWIRLGLGYLAISEIFVGLWQLLLPRSFYDDFPLPGHHWVSTLPAFNEHLLTDLGGLNLGLGVMLVIAGVTLDRTLTRTVLLGYLLYAVPHLFFHLGHLGQFATVDVISQVVTLTSAAALPILLLYALRRR
jgi:hypothetical protein